MSNREMKIETESHGLKDGWIAVKTSLYKYHNISSVKTGI
jgi:hypothetical protein